MTEVFFNAKSFAVIGASSDEKKVGHIIFKNLLQNKLISVFAVNPNSTEILGQKVYKSILELPHPVDCIIIAIKAEFVPQTLREAGQKKIKSAIIISSGFSEAGKKELEEEIKKIAQENKISLLGPNAFGFVNPYRNINTTFFEGIPQKGGIAFISQSGALGVGILDISLKKKIGFSGFVSLGNSALTDFSDFIEYFSNDRNTKVIALYLESLKEDRGNRFIEVCKKCKKPIIAIKSGKTSKGALASKSHTAALASEQGVYESIFKQAGIIEVDNISDLLRASDVIYQYGKIGKRACIVTNAGGLGVLCTDVCENSNLEIVSLPDNIKEKLNKILPTGWSHNNPIDLVGDALADRYESTLRLLDKESFFDFFIVLLTPQYMTQPLETAKILPTLKKPVFTCFYGGEKIAEAKDFLREKILLFRDVKDFGVLGKVTD